MTFLNKRADFSVLIFFLLLVSMPLSCCFARDFNRITAVEMGEMIKSQKGGAVFAVIFFSSRCTYCRKVLPGFINLVKKYPKLKVKGFSIDVSLKHLKKYLESYAEMPFELFNIKPWKGREFRYALRLAEIDIDDFFGVPFIAIYDINGFLVSSGYNIAKAEKAIKSSLNLSAKK